MKNNHLTQQITETLELCLSKISKKLQQDFDPEDKNSIKLLQHYRSTISTFRAWLKQTGEAITNLSSKVKNSLHSNKEKKAKTNSNELPDLSFNYPRSKEHERITALMNQPSGLHYKPASS